jgi:KipI family sensor histidine kinase inhibitor
MNVNPVLEFASDRSILIKIGNDISVETHSKVVCTFNMISNSGIDGIQSIHPAYNSILVSFNPILKSPDAILSELNSLLSSPIDYTHIQYRTIEIPVCYHDEYAPDLADVARYNNLTADEVIYHHTKQNYIVYFLGFSPGFPYLGGMPKEIATPRLQTPRLKVSEGSVAIGGDQTGIYPVASPGGWRIIGRTPLKLFLPEKNPPTLLRMGDRIKFVQITKEQFKKIRSDASNKSN